MAKEEKIPALIAVMLDINADGRIDANELKNYGMIKQWIAEDRVTEMFMIAKIEKHDGKTIAIPYLGYDFLHGKIAPGSHIELADSKQAVIEIYGPKEGRELYPRSGYRFCSFTIDGKLKKAYTYSGRKGDTLEEIPVTQIDYEEILLKRRQEAAKKEEMKIIGEKVSELVLSKDFASLAVPFVRSNKSKLVEWIEHYENTAYNENILTAELKSYIKNEKYGQNNSTATRTALFFILKEIDPAEAVKMASKIVKHEPFGSPLLDAAKRLLDAVEMIQPIKEPEKKKIPIKQ